MESNNEGMYFKMAFGVTIKNLSLYTCEQRPNRPKGRTYFSQGCGDD